MPTSTTTPTLLQPYLFFGGKCEEALQFYGETIGAETLMLMRFSDSPEPMPPGSIPAGFEQKVMHASFRVGESTLMASDGQCETAEPGFHGFTLSLTVPDEAAAQKAFAALAAGGQVRMPLARTFWSPCFGMVADRFGMGWMVTVPDGQHG